LDNLGQKNKLNEEEIMNYNKKIDSLNSVKNELNSQISILNNELEKTNDISFKCVNLERENRKFLEEISSLKLEIDNLNFKLSINKSENNETKQMIDSFQETLNSAKLSHERELKLKIEEINRVKNELESIKKRYDEKEKFEKEILNNHQLNLRKL
jgi:chromosome segregation ATPase